MIFQVSSIIEQIKSLADGSWQLKFSTQELSPEQVASVAELKGKLGWFMFSENTFNESDIPKEQAPEFKDEKSPSQRLRNTLFVYWKENTKQDKTFEVWRNEWIEKKIAEIKKYLPEKE